MSSAASYYVYLLTDPQTCIPFYVGKGRGNRADRHARGSHNPGANQYIAQLRARGCEPAISIDSEGLTAEAAIERECALIRRYGIRGGTLGGVLFNAYKRGVAQKDERVTWDKDTPKSLTVFLDADLHHAFKGALLPLNMTVNDALRLTIHSLVEQLFMLHTEGVPPSLFDGCGISTKGGEKMKRDIANALNEDRERRQSGEGPWAEGAWSAENLGRYRARR